MKATEAKAYILKAKKRIDVIYEELSSISDYENEYEKERNSLSRKIKTTGAKEYIKLLEKLDKKYCEYDNNAIRENILKIELKNIRNMMINAAAVCLLDELPRQPEKAINKPIHYKVFQEAFNNAKKKAWSDFEWLKGEDWKGEIYFRSPFSSYISKNCYGKGNFEIHSIYGGYDVYLGCFIDSNTYKLDIEAAKSYVENLPVIDVEEIKTLVIEGLNTKEEFLRKAAMLEEERKAAMEKYKDISISA
ncbi:MAG: hypothetical protein MR635_03680 [Mollicutes bacterium]|nr:hypothetical protein [Mollicutes bacterium]